MSVLSQPSRSTRDRRGPKFSGTSAAGSGIAVAVASSIDGPATVGSAAELSRKIGSTSTVSPTSASAGELSKTSELVVAWSESERKPTHASTAMPATRTMVATIRLPMTVTLEQGMSCTVSQVHYSAVCKKS